MSHAVSQMRLACVPFLAFLAATLVKRVAADATTADHFVRFSELATLTASVTTEYASALSDGHVDLVEEKRVQSAITKLRDAADSHLCAIGARQRGLKAVS